MLLVYQKNIQDATRQLEMTRAEIMKCRAEVEASQNVASPLAALTEKKAMQTIDVDKFRTLISKLQVIDTLTHSTLHALYPTPCIPHHVFHTLCPTPCIPHHVFHTIHCTLKTQHPVSHTLYSTLSIPHHTLYTQKLSTLYPTPSIPHHLSHAVHCTMFTLRHTPYTPCPAPYTCDG
jgi:hypothetical protein